MDLKSLREDRLKWSYEEFAEKLGVEVSTVQYLEENSDKINLQMIQKLIDITGLKMDEIFAYEKPKVKRVEPDYTWEAVDFTKKSIINYINKKLEECIISEDNRKKYIEGMEDGLNKTWIKPCISIVGRSDTGKSTLINTLIGSEKMPTSWTPTTAIAVYIKHKDDKPDFIESDTWIFADQIDNEVMWDVKRINDREYCERWKVAQGEVEILRTYGIRQGGMGVNKAGAAVVFLDAPILKNCDIVDLPGFGTKAEKDDRLTKIVVPQTDILIYLSQANGFLRDNDIDYLMGTMRNLPIWESKLDNDFKPLSNLYIVASQAHAVNHGSKEQLSYILEEGYKRLCGSLGEDYWKQRQKISGYEDYAKEILKRRFFTYTTDIPLLCERFNSDLQRTVEKLPMLVEDRVKAFLRVYVDSQKPNLEQQIMQFNGLLEKREECKILLDTIDSKELDRVRKNAENKKIIQKRIETLKNESLNEFSQYYETTINTDNIIKLLNDENVKNKKEEIECFARRLQNTIIAKGDEIISNKDQELSIDIQNYIKTYDEGIKSNFDKVSIDMDFDTTFIFATTLATLGILGGLGAYFAGQAMLIWGSVPFLAGIGGSIALNSLTFGPIGIAIGLLIVAGLAIVNLFGGMWEKRVAKKIVDIYDEEHILEKVRESFSNHWKETNNAFHNASEKLEVEWKKYVDNLRQMLTSYDVDEINKKISELEILKNFFDNIPL